MHIKKREKNIKIHLENVINLPRDSRILSKNNIKLLVLILSLCIYICFKTDDFQLTCIVSTVDGNKYCVRERARMKEAADL